MPFIPYYMNAFATFGFDQSLPAHFNVFHGAKPTVHYVCAF